MRTEPTEQENRAAIDALKAEEKPTFKLHSARCGYTEDPSCYWPVYIVVCQDDNDSSVHIGEFPVLVEGDRQRARFLAEKLTRDINAGIYNG